ncbi:MAG: hypothetical protein K0S79_82 [Nitrospira sp.]|jgi:hypothetical protein|nr:hypothetical protein [Nitrospira sp.]
MNPQLLKKDFSLQAEWTLEQASILDRFIERLVGAQIAIRTGTYLGTARANTVSVPDLPGPPKLALLQANAGGTPAYTLVAYPTGDITAWNQKSFTLRAASSYNTMGTTFSYLIIA